MNIDKLSTKFDRFVFYASLAALVFLAFTSWYRRHVVLPEQKRIIENKTYLTIEKLESEKQLLENKIDSLQKIIDESN